MSGSKRSAVEKEKFWRSVLAKQASSGLSVRAFCQREGLAKASFYFWRRELAARDARLDARLDASLDANSPQLIPVQLVDSKAPHTGGAPSQPELAMMEIGIPGGFTLRAGAATDTDHLARWVAAILKLKAHHKTHSPNAHADGPVPGPKVGGTAFPGLAVRLNLRGILLGRSASTGILCDRD